MFTYISMSQEKPQDAGRHMKIVIPGGTGQVGTVLARALHAGGHDVLVLSRTPQPAPWRVMFWNWDTPDGWAA